MKIELNRTVLNICSLCNLKCKHCLAFIPYYKENKVMKYEEAKKIIKVYFDVVDSVKHFTVTGGEPLLNKDCYKILNEVYRYKNQISGTIDFVTNATLDIPDNIIEFFASHKDETKIVLSNYGEGLSKKLPIIEEKMKQLGINYRISQFTGSNLYYNGWIDFTDHSLKWDSIEKRDENASKCIHNLGKYYVINDGELHRCSRSFWRIKNGYIPKIKGEYVDLMNDKLTIEDKQNDLLTMLKSSSSTSCAHCVGLRNDIQRVQPAQQIK